MVILDKLTASRVRKIANTLRLPLTSDTVTKDLYGYSHTILNDVAARRAFVSYWIKAHGVHTLTEDITAAALSEMSLRVETLRAREGLTQQV